MPQRQRVLVLDDEFADTIAAVADRFPDFEILTYRSAQTEPDALAVTRAVITQFEPVDEQLLGAMPELRAVLKMGRNYYNIDMAALRRRELAFAATPRKGPNCVAELALTLMLALSKDLLISHRSVAEGAYRLRGLTPERSAQWKMAFHWMRHTTLHELRGKTLGIVGMGEIGCELARRADVMGMRILYTKRTPLSDELEHEFKAAYRTLDALLAESDYVCLAVPHTDETERMIGREQLAAMKPTAYLVNICRGGVIDEEAMIEALRERRIAGAGLDVFTYEPLPEESPLCRLDNVILTPHVGGGSGTNRTIELGDALEALRELLASSGTPAQT